jgi:DNA ligase-1
MGTRVHSKDILKATIECPVRIVFFDTLVVNGESIMQMPYSERLKVTKSVWENLMVDELPDDIESAYATAINRGYEGVMIKDLDAPYQTKRTDALLKHKPPRVEIDAVIVSAKYGEGKRHGVFGTFEIAILDDNREWKSLGSVGTGLSEGDLMRLTTLLKRIVEKYEGEVFHVLPRIVLEVTADGVTKNELGGFGLRFPRVLRIRDDKSPMDCTEIGDLE